MKDVFGFDELGAGGGGSGQGVVSEGIDSAHDTLGGIEEGLVGGGGEEGSVEAGDLESVFEVEAGGVAIEAAQGEADGDALGEGLERVRRRGIVRAADRLRMAATCRAPPGLMRCFG